MIKAVITGVAGQDGSYLAEYLLDKGYEVIGVTRRRGAGSCLDNIYNILNHKNFELVYGDITDITSMQRVLYDYRPHEWYSLGSLSHVGQSFKDPLATSYTNATAVLGQLESIRLISPHTRFYQASTSELFGGLNCPESGYTEESVFHPRSPYGIAKLSAFWYVKNYREAYNIYACNGILHNHSSIRRNEDFATRKITRGIASVKLGLQNTLKMGNLKPFRDEGHSKDYVKAMHLMLQQKEPDDFLIATGSGATIEDMFKYVCELADLDFEDVYEEDLRFMRPSDVPFLLGNPAKAREKLGWSPEYSWKDLLKEMYLNDLEQLSP